MESLTEYINYYLISTGLYTVLYYLVAARCLPKFIPPFAKLTIDQSKEWISNSASIVTSLICGVGTLIGLLLKSDSELKFRILQILVTALTGYWVSDTLFRLNNLHVLKNRRFQYFLLFHHFLGTIAVQIAILHKEMMDVKLIFILMELGSLFINIRFCLLDLKFERSSPVYEGVSYAMIATFFVTRLLPIPYMYYHAGYKCAWTGEVCSAACRPFVAFNSLLYSIFTALNIYWFYVMVIGVIKHRIRKQLVHDTGEDTFPQQTTDSVTPSQKTADRSAGSDYVTPLDHPETITGNKNEDARSYVENRNDESSVAVQESAPTTKRRCGENLNEQVIDKGFGDEAEVRKRNVGSRSELDAAGSFNGLEAKNDECANEFSKNSEGLKVKIVKQLDALGRSGNLLLDSNESDKEVPISETAESILIHRKQTILE